MSIAYGVEVLGVIGACFGFAFGTYFVFAAIAYQILWVWKKDRFAHKKIQPSPRQAPAVRREISLSLITAGMFAVMLGGLYVLTDLGLTGIYYDVAEHGIAYFAFSIAIIAVLHDSYYYWAHRLMHHRAVYRRVHAVHHQFANPTPFAAYAFHPLEGIIEMAIVAVLLVVMPVHPAALAIYIVVLTGLNVISHLGYELYPAGVSKWAITSTHHNLHHSRARGHYMLYFNIWDRLMGTNLPDYHAIFEALADGKPAAEAPSSAPLSSRT